MGRSDELEGLGRLLRGQRWAALATVGEDGTPLASMVAYCPADDLGSVTLHLSRLAAHTGNLLARPQISLVVTEPDDGRDDPQTLARATLAGEVSAIPRDAADFPALRAGYIARLPESEPLFDFPDFILFRLTVNEARFVGGFARAFTYGPADLARAAEMTR